MKILKLILLLFILQVILVKKVRPNGHKRLNVKKHFRKGQETENQNLAITINSTHPCYTNCMSSLRNQGANTASNTGNGTQLQSAQQKVYYNTLDQPEDPEKHWQPGGAMGHFYKGFKNFLKTGTMLTSDTLGAGMQMQSDINQAQNRVIYNQQLQQKQLDQQKLEAEAQYEKEKIHQVDQIYESQQNSPYYQEQQLAAESQNVKVKRLKKLVQFNQLYLC